MKRFQLNLRYGRALFLLRMTSILARVVERLPWHKAKRAGLSAYSRALLGAAWMWAGKKNYKEAIALASKALQIKEKIYGPQSMEVVEILKDLSSYYRAVGFLAGAQILDSKVAEILNSCEKTSFPK